MNKNIGIQYKKNNDNNKKKLLPIDSKRPENKKKFQK